MNEHAEVFKKAVGRAFYPGTINLEVDREIAIREDRRIKGEEIGEPEDFILGRCLVDGRDGYRIRPWNPENGRGGHGDNILEISCFEEIPGVEVGAEFELELFRDDASAMGSEHID
ncbi:MAG: hypothetical protein ABSG79_01570 [Bryobacteraceae bacterium]|jgi:CTP-dependent riboflavin kinase